MSGKKNMRLHAAVPGEPAKKKVNLGSKAQQTNLSTFFSASTKAVTTKSTAQDDNDTVEESTGQLDVEKESTVDTKIHAEKALSMTASPSGPPDPIVPTKVANPRHVVWKSLHDSSVIIRQTTDDLPPRNKVAAFDLDGTLVVWSTSFKGFWPNQLTHYELWSSTVPMKLRELYDQGFKLVLFTNQGGIQKAHDGKKASLVKDVINFVASLVDRPIHAVMSTKSPKKAASESFHKPSPKMWDVAIASFNGRVAFDLANSFFVGDSADPNDEQGGVDLKFAQAVTEKCHTTTTLRFYTPSEYFGPSDSERRLKQQALTSLTPSPPKEALQARASLMGGYLQGPILLVLCGVQGSGKSTFCTELLGNDDGHAHSSSWVHLSQDTINNGKPGKRELVEDAARDALRSGKSVVVDRMHLDPVQRAFFVDLAKSVSVPVHALLLNPPKQVIAERVRARTNHPAKVQGEEGAKLALKSLDKLVIPTYSEDFQLITLASTVDGVSRLAQRYRSISGHPATTEISKRIPVSENLSVPSITLGTMNLGKKVTKSVMLSVISSSGVRAVDTAPTYKNENCVGEALDELNNSTKSEDPVFCIAKIPKAVTDPEAVRPALDSSLNNLNRPFVDLLLLHWPCDVMSSGTLSDVWKAMEECCKEGKCKALGVCNFNVAALAQLLSVCSIPPVVNQVERHPLLSQMELVDFCEQNNVLIQAHTPLGQGKDELLAHPTIGQIAKLRALTPAMVVLAWNLQHGFAVVPKCSTKEHALELANIFLKKSLLLTPDDMKMLDSLDQAKRFVSPPFMYGDQPFCWSVRAPRR